MQKSIKNTSEHTSYSQNQNAIKNQSSERHVGKIQYEISKSHLGMLGLKILFLIIYLGLLTFIYLSTNQPPLIATLLLGMGGIIIFTKDTLTNWKKIRFDISFLYTVITGGYDWWTPITDNIILGAIPLEHHDIHLIKNKISHILTLLEPFELQNGLIKPLSEKTKKKLQIENKIITTQDFHGVSIENIHQAVEYIHQIITNSNNYKVYIHCKAGRGRSATIVIAYLWKYGINGKKFKDFEEVHAYVKAKRPQINLNQKQKQTIKNYHHRYI